MTNCARANYRPRKSLCVNRRLTSEGRACGVEGVPLPAFPSGRLRDPRGVAVAVGRCRLVLSTASAPVQMYVQPPRRPAGR